MLAQVDLPQPSCTSMVLLLLARSRLAMVLDVLLLSHAHLRALDNLHLMDQTPALHMYIVRALNPLCNTSPLSFDNYHEHQDDHHGQQHRVDLRSYSQLRAYEDTHHNPNVQCEDLKVISR